MKKSTIFIILSCIFLGFLVVFYGGRMIHFYSLMKQNEKVGEATLASIVKSKSYDPFLLEENNNLYYQGNVLNNYVYYSNRYFRIIGVEDNQVILVDDIQTILPFQKDIENNDIHVWLNDPEKGVYYSSLFYNDQYLTDTKTCLDIECNSHTTSLVGMISPYQYHKADKNGNYLNDSNFYWLSDGSYLDNQNNVVENDDGLYGVRAVITLKKDVPYYGGTGTYYDPYFITKEDALTFNHSQMDTIKVGSYIQYSDKVWKVVSMDKTIKLVLTDSIGDFVFSSSNNQFDIEDKDSIAYYLNHTFYEQLDKTHLVKGTFYTGDYINSYLDKYTDSVTSYVGLMEIGDLFINDYSNYVTLTNTGIKNTIYKVVNGKFFADSYKNENAIVPVIHLNKDVKVIEGYGTLESPYKVGEA